MQDPGLSREYARYAHGPRLQVGVVPEIDLPQHETAEPAPGGHSPAHARSKIVVRALSRPAHEHIDIAANAALAALAPEEVGLVDPDAPTARACTARGQRGLEDRDGLCGEAQRLGQHGPAGPARDRIEGHAAQGHGLVRAIGETQAIVPPDADAGQRAGKCEACAEISGQRG